VIYSSRIRDVVHVLHRFEKKSRETPAKEINIAGQRLPLSARGSHQRRGKES
jgi:phage-related protein